MKRVKVSQLMTHEQFGCSPDYFEKFIKGKFFPVIHQTEAFVYFSDSHSPERSVFDGVSYDWCLTYADSRSKVAVLKCDQTLDLIGELIEEFGEENVELTTACEKPQIREWHREHIEDIFLPNPFDCEHTLDMIINSDKIVRERKSRFTLHFLNAEESYPIHERKLRMLGHLQNVYPKKLAELESAFTNPFVKFSFQKLENLLD